MDVHFSVDSACGASPDNRYNSVMRGIARW